MLRVGIDATILAIPKAPTGVYTYTAQLVRELARLPDVRLYLYFAQHPPAHDPLLAELAPLVTFRAAPFTRGWRRAGMGIMMLADRLDVFHFPSPLIGGFCPVPMIVTIHDVAALSVHADASARERDALPGIRAAARRARRLIAVSRSAADEMRAHFGADAVVTHEAADQTRFHPSQRDPGITRALVGDAPYVLCVGTLHTRKNHLRLLQAWEQLQADVPHTLVIAGGDGTGSAAVGDFLAARPHLRVRRLGYVDAAALPALYTGAAAFVLVSLWEGFGLPILEAMASGTPVVTSNTSSLAEVAGGAALLVDPQDAAQIAAALKRTLTDAALRDHLRAAGTARANEFTWARAAHETLAVYRAASAA
jgi:glycosyltransferase involved in cell wall biosynthesis